MVYLIRLILMLPLAANAQSTLPVCPGSFNPTTWTNCFGTREFTGGKYVGEFMDGFYHGNGISYVANGSVASVGRWELGSFVQRLPLNAAYFAFSTNNSQSISPLTTLPDRRRLQELLAPAQPTLPPCNGMYSTSSYTNCVGSYPFARGSKYVGDFKNGVFHGFGVIYGPRGEIERSGRWAEGQLIQQGSHANNHSVMPWKSRLDNAVQSELKNWLASNTSDLDEIPTPVYPAGLSLKQDAWESNREFEDRVERARTERRQAIDRIQAEYRARVDDRNRRVIEFNRSRWERESKFSDKRRELIFAALEILDPTMSLSDFAFDQQTGALSIQAQIEGLNPRVFSFTETPQAFRKSALTEPATIRSKPEFQVSDSGEISLKSILVEAGGFSARGIPSAGVTAPVQIATVTIPQATSPALAQQSAITVDRNQVEQILYREENEMLRKRLEEQRTQQERAVATEQAKAAAEIARLRAEAEALKKQPEARPVTNYASVQEAHALVIGNSAYPGNNRLANPANDAKAMSAKLRSMGFKVTEIANANRDQMVAGLSEFSKTASRADLSLLFYAGHGVQIAGTNYMLPVDMRLNDPSQATLQAVSLTQVVEQYLPGKTKLVFLDACRDNPLMVSGSRGVSKGLAPISVTEGTLIAYATKDGQTADDGTGQVNSPFTAALLEHLADPDDIAVVLRTVRAKVMSRTNSRQQPWEYGSLTGGALVLSAIKR